MNVVGRVSSFITQGVYSVATPFHPFGGAVDIIVVKQHDGSYRSTPWYVRFGKFQGVLKGAEKIVRIEVNGAEVDFQMHLDNSGEAYFVREVDLDSEDGISVEGLKDSENFVVGAENIASLKEVGLSGHEGGNIGVVGIEKCGTIGLERLERADSERIFYEVDEHSSLDGSDDFSEYGVDSALESQELSSEVVLVSVDGHILMAPISTEKNAEDVQLGTPQFHLGPGKEPAEYDREEDTWTVDYLKDFDASACDVLNAENIIEGNEDKELCVGSEPQPMGRSLNRRDVYKSCLELHELSGPVDEDQENMSSSPMGNLEAVAADDDSNNKSLVNDGKSEGTDLEISSNCDELSLKDSGNQSSVSSPQKLQVEVEAVAHEESNLDTHRDGSDSNHEESNLDTHHDSSDNNHEESNLDTHPDGSDSNREEILKQVEIDQTVGSECSFLEPPSSDVCSKSELSDDVEPLKSNLSTDFGLELPIEPDNILPVDKENPETKKNDESEISSTAPSTPSRRWRLWPIPFRRVKTLEHSGSGSSNEDAFADTGSVASEDLRGVETPTSWSPRKQIVRTNVPTTYQIESLNLREGQNMVNFIFSTRVLGCQKVEAHIYLWKWNTRIVISDVDGTITKSDVLGQFMPLVGKDWTHSGIAHLFSAIKENGYQLLFLSARAIVQAYLTKNFLFNLKQDGKSLPSGPVVISPDGLFPSLYREVIRRAPHEFKIACLEDIKALFPPDYNPFYAGFGNRDTDELSYRKIGIPKGKIFIINPKGEVAINNRIDVKSYTSLHTLVNDMFPPTSLVEQEDYNSWNYWKMPLPDIE